MIYKGCVVKIEEDFAVVMTNTMEYLKVIKKEGLKVGGQIMFVQDDLYREKRRSYKAIASIAAVLIIMIMSAALAGMLQIPGSVSSAAAAVVSIDINPSMEFEVDHNHQIIKVVAFNKEAKKLLNKDVKGMNIGDAIWLVINNARLLNYITDEKNTVLIGATILQEDFSVDIDGLENGVEEKWAQEYESVPLNLVYLETDKENLKDARKEKITVGKYQVYKNSIEEDDDITTENIKEMKVQEMVNKKLLKLQEKEIKNKSKTDSRQQEDTLDEKGKKQDDKEKKDQEKLKEQNQINSNEKKTDKTNSKGEVVNQPETKNNANNEKLKNDENKKKQDEKKKENQQNPVEKIEKKPDVKENDKNSKKEDSDSGKKAKQDQDENQTNSGEEKKHGDDKKSD